MGVVAQGFCRRKLPSVLGKESFVEKIKTLFFTEKSHEKVPESKYLAPDSDKIIIAVCEFYGTSVDELLISRRGYFNEARNVAIYLIRRLRGDTLKMVGEVFNIEKNSTVSSVVERVKIELKKDKAMRGRVEKVTNIISKGQA